MLFEIVATIAAGLVSLYFWLVTPSQARIMLNLASTI
jgi:hypothetical protein